MANHSEQRRTANQPEVMRPRDWFVKPGGELVARRADVWALLGWYHMTQVKPHLGFAGVMRRLWWRITGRKVLLLSPWEQIIERRAAIKVERQARAALGRELESGEPDAAGTAKPSIIVS